MVGFKIQNLDDIKSIFYCPYCSLLLRDPVQLIHCGHRQCQSCLDDQEGDIIICSECHEETSREKLMPDRGFRNDMQTLPTSCTLCKWVGILKNYQNHLNQNHPNPICNDCNEKFTSVNDLYRHQQFICKKVTVDCPLKSIGCEERVLRMDLLKHYLTEQHQRVLIKFIHQTRKRILHQTAYLTADQIKEIDESINILSNGIDTLNDDIKRLGTESVQCQNILQPVMQGLPILKQSIDEQNTFLDGLKPNQEILEQDILLTKQKFDEIQSISYDGIYIWKISNVQEKMAAAQSGAQASIYSLPFYSSPTGYKMCLRLYLNGDGNGLQTHMSLFFVLMRSEYDAILHFPFCFKVIFCLYDQTNQQNHIIDVLRPVITSNSLQRPQSDMNIPLGIPKFASLKLLQQENNPYIRDDTMFIKTMIDFSNIPKDLLSYALNLSPGLTIQMQQTMIREKTETQKTSNSSMTMDSQQTNTLLNLS